MNVRVIIACGNASGEPSFFATTVTCTAEEINNGDHYELAKQRARDEDYEGQMVCFDENDGPDWLFEQIDTDT